MLKLEGWGRWRIIAAGLALLVLGGCSLLRLAYGQADTLIYRWLDAQLDLTAAQEPDARAAIAGWLDWHRREQLPELAALLDRAASEVLQDTTPARLCGWFDTLRAQRDRAVGQALPAAAALAVRLDTRQLDHLAARHAKARAEDRETFVAPDRPARLAAALERGIERAERLYGRLDAAQRERFAQGLGASPFDAELWTLQREQRRQMLLQTLRRVSGGAPEQAVGALQAYWRGVQQPPDDADRRRAAQLLTYNCELAARLHNTTTPAQRLAAQRQLQDWQTDLRGIVAVR